MPLKCDPRPDEAHRVTAEPPVTGHPGAPPGPGAAVGLPPGLPPPAGTSPAWAYPPPAVLPSWGAAPPQGAGWGEPPAGAPAWQAPAWQPPARRREGSESGIPLGWALGATAVVLLMSFFLNRYDGGAGDRAQPVDALLRRALVVTLFFYLAVGMGVLAFCQLTRVRLTWTRSGGALSALAVGVPAGLGGGLLAVGVNSAIRGHLSGDPRAELLVGGGGALRITLALVVMAGLAPLVEETLFRGVLAGTLLGKGFAPALWGSALAFSVWHMNPESLKYYVFMGLLLFALWRTRGLVASMAAHAAFNGVLTLAAVAATTGAGHLVQAGGASLLLPGGWHEVRGTFSAHLLVASGPGGAGLDLMRQEGASTSTADELADLQQRGQVGLVRVVAGSVHVVRLPAGEGVEADVVAAGQPGHVLRLSAGSSSYQLIVITGGSPAAERDWTRITRSLQLPLA